MGNTQIKKIAIIGGGLAGLTSAIHLSAHGISVVLIEKNTFPKHKVCGEYISNEVIPYLNRLGIDPFTQGAVAIDTLEFSTTEGKGISSKLPLGGFGISRYALDHYLFEKVKDAVEVVQDTATQVSFHSDHFEIQTQKHGVFKAEYVLGAFGKRSNLDVSMQRQFIKNRSPWVAVKAHYKADIQNNVVALHNFKGGYCGISSVEHDTVNVCYLASLNTFKKFETISRFEEEVLFQNHHLETFFKNATPIFKKPLTIAQVSFDKKEAVKDHLFMLGDSAGLIHPLCGNGMAMAIHSAKLFSELFIRQSNTSNIDRNTLEIKYAMKWKEAFHTRLQRGKMLQNVLLNPTISSLGVRIAKQFPSLVPSLIKQTHGELLV